MRALAETTILALGDSQTYGTGVAPKQTWPRQLQELTDTTVYSVAYGGWGPTQHLVLWDEVRSLHPRIVLQAFYAGNDLYDSYAMVYSRGVLPDYLSPDELIRGQIAALEVQEPLSAQIKKVAWFSMTNEHKHAFANDRLAQPAEVSAIRVCLSRYSRLYGVLRAMKRKVCPEAGDETPWAAYDLPADQKDVLWAELRERASQDDYAILFETPQFKTTFTCEYRLCGLDVTDLRIREGLRISIDAIRTMHESVSNTNAMHWVILIPTKELVFKHEVRKATPGTIPPAYQALIENEERMWSTTIAQLDKARIPYIDMLPALRECLTNGDQPYKMSRDGHPNAIGHHAIAQCIAKRLQKDKEIERRQLLSHMSAKKGGTE